MPLSHLTLTVSHLPTSTSFFLACLQPLGYRFIGRHDNSVGFGAEPGEPADFWISEERPGVPAGAAHIAFPAPSRDAVSQFFITALKAGGKIHGEPCLRDAEQSYYSAAVIDFDGNSIEAVHRPGTSRSRPRSTEKALSALENGTMVSKATSVKSRSMARQKSSGSDAGSIAAKSVSSSVHHRSVGAEPRVTVSPIPASTQLQVPPVKDNGVNSAKAVVGTLIGAAAGAAIAYAMVKGEAQSAAAAQAAAAVASAPAQSHYVQASSPATSSPLAQSLPEARAIEQAPGLEGLSEFARTTLARNPKASTIFDSLETCTRFLGGAKAASVRGDEHYVKPRRNSTTGSLVYSAGSDMNIPIRAIEGVPSDHDSGCSECSRMYPINGASTFISSFAERPRRRETDGGASSIYSSSTIKPSKQASSSASRQSSRSSIITFNELSSKKSGTATPTGASLYSTQSARNIPLPSVDGSSLASRDSHRHSNHSHRSHDHDRHHYTGSATAHSIKSYRSAHDIPLPLSVASGASTIFFEGIDVDSHIIPDHHSSRSRSKLSSSHHHHHAPTSSHHHSHASSHRRSPSSSGRSKRSSATTSSKFDEPVRPCDSVSQVSTNVSKKSSKSSRR